MMVMSSLLPTIAVVGSVIYQEKIVTALSEGKEINYILHITLWLTAMIYVPQIIQSIIDTCFTTLVCEKVEMQTYNEIYTKACKTDYKYFDDPEFYDNYSWTLNQRVQKGDQARGMIMSFFSSIATILSVSSVIIIQDWFIILITIVTLVIGLLLGTIRNKMAYTKHEESIKPYRILAYIRRVFYEKENASDIKNTNISVKLIKMFEDTYNEIFNIIKKYSIKFAWNNSATFILNAIAQITITMYLSYRVTINAIPIGGFVGLIAASGVLGNRLSQIFGFIQNSNELSLYADRLRQFETSFSQIESCKSSEVCDSGAFDIEMRNVCFSYPNSPFRIKNINIHIQKGEKIAIVGENGGGKTTLTKLLARLYDPDDGSILIDGKNIKEYSIKEIRNQIGIAPQIPNIYALTFKDNITLYNESVSAEELKKVCEMLRLDTILKKTGSTLESYMTKEFNENGIVLSTGEMQKLALARLCTKQFGLIILDEASSALDPIAEDEMNKILFERAQKTTTIMIAHRLSNVRNADCIYLIKNGEIAEFGNHEELMKKKGVYYNMFNKQAKNYVEGTASI